MINASPCILKAREVFILQHFSPYRARSLKILLRNVEMPTSVGILTFTNMINTSPEVYASKRIIYFLTFSPYEQLKFHVQLS